jgi:hypothetical protein
MVSPWKPDGDDSAASMEKETRRMKPLARRYIEWRYPSRRSKGDEPVVDADTDWTPLSRHWRARALLAWLLNLLVLALWLGVSTFLMFHVERWRHRWSDPYWYGSMAWSVVPALYSLGGLRDRRKRLKPSPFFFWFSGW